MNKNKTQQVSKQNRIKRKLKRKVNKVNQELKLVRQVAQNPINPVVKKLNKLSMLKQQDEVQVHTVKSYEATLKDWKHVTGVGISGGLESTFKYTVKVPYQFACNATGNLFILWFPSTVTDNATTSSNFYVDNAVTAIGTAVDATTGHTAYTLDNKIQNGLFKGARVVSAGMEVYSALSDNNAQGIVVLASDATSQTNGLTAAGASILTYNQWTLFSTINNCQNKVTELLKHTAHAQASYVPIDSEDFRLNTPNNNKYAQGGNIAVDTPLIAGYVSAAGAGAIINVDLYINYEFSADGTSFISSACTMEPDRTNPTDAVYRMRLDPYNVCRSHTTSSEHLHSQLVGDNSKATFFVKAKNNKNYGFYDWSSVPSY
jgi:hypothetical protein